ncbi:UNVERIFIED_CONTAM: hypothetical protein Slati_0303000 [Sesamum latifolium]|uniref:Uncharacterized protein n=1 Tax=Sesamum latifolium TaxID=2727402 RepID=A0AAW2YEE8_9LAMI
MMWMMGYNDGAEFNSMQDPFSGRKLRPLMPSHQPPPPPPPHTTPPCLTRIHGSDHLLAFNHHLGKSSLISFIY